MEHESGLPFAIDRATSKEEQQSVVFYGERPFIQGGELNEMQTIIRGRHDRLGRLVAKEGDRIERADAFVDIEKKTVTLTSGKIYVAGDIFPVEETVLTGVAMVGRVEIGVRLQKAWITHEDDPILLGQVPGSLAEGEPGAARETAKLVWALSNDKQSGAFYPVYVLQDGTIIDQRAPSLLEPAMQAIATYDRAHGHYIVSGCRVTALGQSAGNQVFSVEEGEANISGFKRARKAALRYQEQEDWSEAAVPGETHTYPSGAKFTFQTNQYPIGQIRSILLTKEKTVNVTRGATVAGQDGLPDKSVTNIVKITQGTTTFKEGADFIKNGDTIDWAPAGAEPVPGSTYSVTYRYRVEVTADVITAREITISGGAAGGDIIVSYTYKLPRIDRIGLNTDGITVYIKGVSADQPFPPPVPGDVLSLATITNNWLDKPAVVNDGVRVAPYEEMWRYFERVLDLDRLMQLERIKNNVDAKEPVAKKGMFVDPFEDDSLRDEGFKQTGAIGYGLLQLAIDPTFYTVNLVAPVTLDWKNEAIITQELITSCEKINPYQNFAVLPGTVSLTPATDFWHEQQTEWLSGQTSAFWMGKMKRTRINVSFDQQNRNEGRVTEVNDELVSSRQEQIEFLRPIDVAFRIEGFGKGEILDTLTFDGLSVLPKVKLTADKDGIIEGQFKIPENVTAGTKTIEAKGKGGTTATGMFTGQGVIDVDIMRRTTTIKVWTLYDPQAQVFTPDETRQITGVDFHICKVGNSNNNLMIDIVTTDNGYPTADIQAQAFYSMKDAKLGWAQARYDVPLTLQNDRLSAFVVKTDDGEHSISLAKLGAFDEEKQRYVTSHPYTTGPRFSSVNAQTWTAHQDEALAFRIMAAHYPVTQKIVDLGSFNLKDCSDLQVRAAVELPSVDCSVVFEIERNNGTVYQLLPFQILSLTEYITETVKLRAVLKGTKKLSPILFAPVELIAGEIHQEATYISRAFNYGEKSRLTSYIKTYLPGGATFKMEISLDGGAFAPLALAETEQLALPLWTEQKFTGGDKTAKQARLKITMTGGPAARALACDYGAGIM